MSWEAFYFCCFLIGFLLSLVSFLVGSGHHLHFSHGLHVHGLHGGHGGAGRGGQNSIFNFATMAAFLAWFGGAGYLLSRYSSIWTLLALGIAFASGLGGAATVFWVVFKVLLKHERDLDPADYELIGALGHVSSTVRPGGTGEMIFSQNGVRRAAVIRCETGQGIGKGTEVVVTRHEKGIAYVRRWDEISEAKAGTSSEEREG